MIEYMQKNYLNLLLKDYVKKSFIGYLIHLLNNFWKSRNHHKIPSTQLYKTFRPKKQKYRKINQTGNNSGNTNTMK